ncbi:MAG: PIG-U family protein [Candidatus Methanoplasma sp.]|jgi:hypothetical protein|nr:PIG-U family protein [Candidatus Methanoplasma sp.]
MVGVLAGRYVYEHVAGMLARPLAIILISGLAVRVIVIPLFSFDYDLSFWVATGQGLEGGRDIYETSYYWYTPIWGYIISITTGFGNLLGMSIPGEMFSELVSSSEAATIMNTTITTIAANILYKTPLLIIDLITAWVLHGIVKHMTGNDKKAALAFGLWFLCPLVIWSSSVACMFDSLSAMFALFAFLFLIKGNYILSGSAFALAVSTKIFPFCMTLIILAYIISKHRNDIQTAIMSVVRFIASGLTILFAIYLPVILKGSLSRSFEFFYSRSASVSSSSFDLIAMLTDISYNQIIRFAPILMISLILVGLWMYKSNSDERDRNLIMATVMSFTIMFIWPPTPTYPVVMIPFLALAITICERRDLVWSWIFFSAIMVLAAFSIFHLQLLYTVAAYTDFLDLGSLLSSISDNSEIFALLETIFRYLEFLPGLSVVLILCSGRRKRILEMHIREESASG